METLAATTGSSAARTRATVRIVSAHLPVPARLRQPSIIWGGLSSLAAIRGLLRHCAALHLRTQLAFLRPCQKQRLHCMYSTCDTMLIKMYLLVHLVHGRRIHPSCTTTTSSPTLAKSTSSSTSAVRAAAPKITTTTEAATAISSPPVIACRPIIADADAAAATTTTTKCCR